MVEPGEREVAGILGQRFLQGVGLDHFGQPQARGAAEHDQVDQAVGAQPVGAVDADAGGFADREQAGHDRLGSPSFKVTTSP